MESFYKHKQAIIRRRLETLYTHDGIDDDTQFDHVSDLELADITAALIEIRDALKQLQWYDFINYERILGKIARLAVPGQQELNKAILPSSTPDIRARCLGDLSAISHQLAKVSKRATKGHSVSLQSSFLQQKSSPNPEQSSFMEKAFCAISDGNATVLQMALEQYHEVKELQHGPSDELLVLLHACVLTESDGCFDHLLSHIGSLSGISVHLRWLAVKIGRASKSQHGLRSDAASTQCQTVTLNVANASRKLLSIIHRIGNLHTGELYKKDTLGRCPLHYALEYGLLEICQCLLKKMAVYTTADQEFDRNPVLIQDLTGSTVLRLAVLTGNAAMTELLLKSLDQDSTAVSNPVLSYNSSPPGDLLPMAVRLGLFTIVQLLLSANFNVNYQSHNDETALYLAVHAGRLDFITAILGRLNEGGTIDVNSSEAVYGWTPLILACIKGNVPIIDVLLRNNADPTRRDLRGWTAKDHAAFRDWESIAQRVNSNRVESKRNRLKSPTQ